LIQSIINHIRITHITKRCEQIDAGGYCTYWKYDFKPGFFTITDNLIGPDFYKEIVLNKLKTVWLYKATEFNCKDCALVKLRDIKNQIIMQPSGYLDH
jgi:hypothetical protein